jgi:predicted amidohydrolase
MSKSIKIAVIQLNAAPAPVTEKLARAETFIAQSAAQGAQLVILPEVFNTGYEYSDENYARAESLDGMTAQWMKKTSTHYGVHLAGSFLRKEEREIFNTLLLVAPNGDTWHYDKNYPWVWERAYFRERKNIAVAETALGKIGFLICWDVAHPNLWAQYAGKVQLMVVSSCPPKPLDATFIFPNGKRKIGEGAGKFFANLKRSSDDTFGKLLRRQASALGVPVAQATSTGFFTSPIPSPKISLTMLALIDARLLKYAAQFEHARMETVYFNDTYISDESGNVLQSVHPDEEGFALGEVSLPETPPQPKSKQPPFGISPLTYLLDIVANLIMTFKYKSRASR